MGSDVEVLQPDNSSWRSATVTNVDPSNQTYTVLYDDNSTLDSAVTPNRIRKRPVADLPPISPSNLSLHQANRLEVVSEIIESERSYVSALNNLKAHYIEPLTKPGKRTDCL